MDALRLICGFFLTTWLVWTLTILLLNIDLEKYRIPTTSLYLIDPCTKIWTVCKMNASKCCVLNCKKTRPDIILHKFPDPEKELDRFNMWIYAIGGNVLVIDPKSVFKNGRVCHSHFEPKFSTASKRLSKNAVPSLFLSGIRSSLPLQNVTNITRTRQTIFSGQRCEQVLQPAVISPNQPAPSVFEQPAPSTSKGKQDVKRTIFRSFDSDTIMLKNKIKKLQGQKDSAMTRLKKALKLSENETFKKAVSKFSSAANIFTMLQFREAGKHKLGCRFTKSEKIMALALYKQGPRAYRWLRKFF